MSDTERRNRRDMLAARFLVGLVGTMAIGEVAFAGVFHVDADAPAGGNGASWASAFQSLQAALDAAVATPGADDIWIAEGLYIPEKESQVGTPRSRRFTLFGDVSLLGGFAGTELSAEDRNPIAHPVVLSGDVLKNDTGQPSTLTDNVANIVVLSGAGVRTIDGVTIRAAVGGVSGFTGDTGHAVSIQGGSLTLKRSVVRDNSGKSGAGVSLMANTTLVVDGCEFTRNVSVNIGGGLHLDLGGTVLVRNSSFFSNRVGQGASAIAGSNAWLTILDCSFESNASGNNGPAVFAQSSIATQPTVMAGCAFRRNTNAAATIVGSSLVVDCLFEQNLGVGLSIAGTGAQSLVAGSVFRDNRTGLEIGGAEATVSGCLFEWNRRDSDGAALSGFATTLTVSNCLFQYNRASGSAVYVWSDSARFEHCEFRGNFGGTLRLANSAGEAEVADCLFVANSSASQQSVLAAACQYVLVEDSTFAGNGNLESGSVFLALGSGDVRRCVFEGNEMGQGGAMSLAANQPLGGMRIANCRFVGNRAPAVLPISGGAIWVTQGIHTFQNCIFSGNIGRGSGGAIAVSGNSSVAVEQCALIENDAGVTGNSPGGGIFVSGGLCAVRNSIIWGSGAGAFASQLSGPAGSITVNGSIVQGWNGSFPGAGNSALNPLFVGVVGPDGLLGTSDDSAEVLPGSPAIGGGLLSALGADVADLDGDGNRIELLPLDIYNAVRVLGTIDRGPIER
jgi:hypothetical protein